MTQSSINLPIVIAAGGNGNRIGGDKPNMILDGTSLIDRIMVLASRWSDQIAIASRVETKFTMLSAAEFLYDNDMNGGPLSALSSALVYAQVKRANHVLLIPCDMPFLPPDLLQRLVLQIGSSQVAIARNCGQVYPICALWRTDIVANLAEYVATGRRSLIGFAESINMTIVDWGLEEADAFFNINTLQDLEQAALILRIQAEAQHFTTRASSST